MALSVKELNEVINKKIKITSAANSLSLYEDVVGKTGVVEYISNSGYGIAIDGVKHPNNKNGIFWFHRENFKVLEDEPLVKEKEYRNMQHIVQRVFLRAKLKLDDVFLSYKNETLLLDETYQRAMCLVEEIHNINDEVSSGVKHRITLDPFGYSSPSTLQSIMNSEKKLIQYKNYLDEKRDNIIEQLDAFSSLPLEQERILVAYDICHSNGTIKPVSIKVLKHLLDLPENNNIFS